MQLGLVAFFLLFDPALHAFISNVLCDGRIQSSKANKRLRGDELQVVGLDQERDKQILAKIIGQVLG